MLNEPTVDKLHQLRLGSMWAPQTSDLGWDRAHFEGTGGTANAVDNHEDLLARAERDRVLREVPIPLVLVSIAAP